MYEKRRHRSASASDNSNQGLPFQFIDSLGRTCQGTSMVNYGMKIKRYRGLRYSQMSRISRSSSRDRITDISASKIGFGLLILTLHSYIYIRNEAKGLRIGSIYYEQDTTLC